MRLVPFAVTAAAFWLLFCPQGAYSQQSNRRPPAGAPTVRWIGQDGHDFVGPHNRSEPSDVQDVHLVLEGLDPDREITHLDLKATDPWNEWEHNRASFAWVAAVKREKGSRKADVFLEPGTTDAARTYQILIEYDDGRKFDFEIRGRRVNRNLRMPGASIQAKWIGQDRHDRVATGPSVGPDGLQDARIRLAGISSKVPVAYIRLEGQGAKWQSGPNPELLSNAEFWPDPNKQGEGELHFQPARDLKGQRLKIVVRYANETEDSTTVLAGRCDPSLRMPETSLPRLSHVDGKVEWLGQDGQEPGPRGAVHIRVSGLPRSSGVAEAMLTDAVGSAWAFQAGQQGPVQDADGKTYVPLIVRNDPAGSALDLYFAPDRNEAKTMLTLRLVDSSKRMSVLKFEGGACDPGQRSPRPAESRATAHPGDDLNKLANQNGTLILSPGTYRLASPIVLENPVTIDGGGKATLVFAQGAGEPPWATAIKVHSGNTTLNGFAVRFEGKVRWDNEVSYGPAVIGTTDNRDRDRPGPRVNIAFTRLDLESPAAEDPSKWSDAIRLMRLTGAACGTIAGNILRGGTIEFFEGPWHILNNDFRGTPVGTVSHGVFTGHYTHELVVKGNRIQPVEPAGKTWRFLVLTHRGIRDHVDENTIRGIGARKDDTIPWINAPEIILTEAYHIAYEGRIQALSSDGLLLRTHRRQGNPVGAGDVVCLLTGPSAGEFRRIAQVIDAETYLVDSPIPKGTEVVSVCRGFVECAFRKNLIAMNPGRRSDGFTSDGLIMPGNHFGTHVSGNHISGGGLALKLAACPSETPVIWGWSHAPFLAAVIDGNTLEDAIGGARLGVEHSAKYVKSNQGRAYMSISLNDNVVRWTEEFLKWRVESSDKNPPIGLVLGEHPSHDAAELIVRASGNRLEAPAGTDAGSSLVIDAAEYNGQKLIRRKYSLSAGEDAGSRGSTTTSRRRSSPSTGR